MDIENRKKNSMQKAIENGLLSSESPLQIFMDLDCLTQSFSLLKTLWGEKTIHAMACKANPVKKVLELAAENGMGCEVASRCELEMAMGIFEHRKIVFDSPCKTWDDLKCAMRNGVFVNADNFQEVERIALLQEDFPTGRVGLRINPQVGAGSIISSSTAFSTSKFGIALNDYREEIVELYSNYSWLTGIHIHIGSQGMDIDKLVEGARVIMDFILELNQIKIENQMPIVSTIDIGGGVSIDYHSDLDLEQRHTIYISALRESVPELFDDKFELITEFGRSINAKAGWTGSIVEYTKKSGGREIAIIHAGADLFLRTAYLPNDWPLRLSVYDEKGEMPTDRDSIYDIAGPLCFSGDLIGRELVMPHIKPGFFIQIHDTGAYTLSMWSKYNSRRKPGMIGYIVDENGNFLFEEIMKGESVQDVLNFWQ